jgi:hypothetical protein
MVHSGPHRNTTVHASIYNAERCQRYVGLSFSPRIPDIPSNNNNNINENISVAGELLRLRTVLTSAQRHIHSSSHLFKLAQDAFRFATPENGPRHPPLLTVAFELGLQVCTNTTNACYVMVSRFELETLYDKSKYTP